jgi:hypothetical protein
LSTATPTESRRFGTRPWRPPDTAYAFTFWLADVDLEVYNTAPETLEFLVNGSVVPGCSGYSPSTPGQWVEETCNYTSGAGSTETLAFVDTETAFESNDFAIDNISDPPPARRFPSPAPRRFSALGCWPPLPERCAHKPS